MHHPLAKCKADCEAQVHQPTAPTVLTTSDFGSTIDQSLCIEIYDDKSGTGDIKYYHCYTKNTPAQCEAACKAGKAPYCPAIEQKGMFR
jgi:hypothetical protein